MPHLARLPELLRPAGAGNDYQKDQQFRKLNEQKDSIKVKAIRDGKELLVPNTDIVVGDVLLLDAGDKLVADGIVVCHPAPTSKDTLFLEYAERLQDLAYIPVLPALS